MKKFLPLIIIAAVGIVLVFNSELIGDLQGNSDAVYHIDVKTSEPEEEFLDVDLYNAYTSDSKPQDLTEKVIGVEGTVESVGRNSTGDYIVILKGGVSCSFNKNDKNQVSSLSKGTIIKAKGINIGYSEIKDRVFLVLCKLQSVR